MHWIAPSEKDTDNAALEKRLWDSADTATCTSTSSESEATWRDLREAQDHWSANSGLKAQEYSGPTLLKELLKKVSEIPATVDYNALGRIYERGERPTAQCEFRSVGSSTIAIGHSPFAIAPPCIVRLLTGVNLATPNHGTERFN